MLLKAECAQLDCFQQVTRTQIFTETGVRSRRQVVVNSGYGWQKQDVASHHMGAGGQHMAAAESYAPGPSPKPKPNNDGKS